MLSKESVIKLQGLKNRISELHDLKVTEPKFKAWRSDTERALKTIFKEKSVESDQFLNIEYYPSFVSSYTPDSYLNEVYENGLQEAELLLDSLISEASEKLPEPTNELFSSVLKLHPKIIAVTEKLFSDGHYSKSIFDAIIVLEQEVKQRSGITNKIGVNLMTEVFNTNSPILKINQGLTQEDRDEQEGFMHLMMGTILGIKNPKSHSIVNLTNPIAAVEYLAFVSILLRRVESATK